MASGLETQLTRQIGEHLVAAKLGRLGFIATPFAGNVPDFDIIAANPAGRALPIQVKAIRGASWQFLISAFLKVDFVGETQRVRGVLPDTRGNRTFVLVKLNDNGADDFYVLTYRDLQRHFLKSYKSRRRPRNPKSLHCAIWPKEILRFRDNWNLIKSRLRSKTLAQRTPR